MRPYPSLRILFASPSLRIPGMLQSPFMNRIGSSDRVREELVAALAEGRGVTARVRWVTRPDEEGRNRWIHCTPLLGNNGGIGVWMVVIVDDESSKPSRKFRQAPPVATEIGRQSQQRVRTYYDRSSLETSSRPPTALNVRDGGSSRPGTSHSGYPTINIATSPEPTGANDFDFRIR